VVAGGILGARILYVLLFFPSEDYFSWRALAFYRGGLVFYGGLAGGLLAGLLFTGWQKLVSSQAYFLVALCIAHGIGRIGCVFHGCCYGAVIPENSVFSAIGLVYPNQHLPRYPTQLVEAAFLLFLAIGLYYFYFRPRRSGAFYAYAFLYGSFRFMIEFWRADNRGNIPGIAFLSTSQTISLFLMLAVFIHIVWSVKNKHLRKNPSDAKI
jgi:phosphatidylglycerol:prolipoprotein diacylglycerol transferase